MKQDVDAATRYYSVIKDNIYYMKAALKEAVQKYEGTVILVTHEEDFADGLCNIIFNAKSKF